MADDMGSGVATATAAEPATPPKATIDDVQAALELAENPCVTSFGLTMSLGDGAFVSVSVSHPPRS